MSASPGERSTPLTYRAAGVDLEAGEEAVRRISEHVRSTYRPEVIGDVGGFGGLFRFDPGGRHDPVLVSTTDGAGTKVLIARMANRHDTIGIDLVAMSVDDLVCLGAEPLFFVDYIAIGHVVPDTIDALMEGMARGCREARCALVAGEIAEHPDALPPDAYDLVGFAVGIVDRPLMVTGERIQPGDVLVGLASKGLRSNGYSLVRRLFFDRLGMSLDDRPGGLGRLEDELLRPSVIYARAVLDTMAEVDVRGAAHITGGGIPGKLGRILPPRVDAVVHLRAWQPDPIFGVIEDLGSIDQDEMYRVFNMGIGMVLVIAPDDLYRCIDAVRAAGHEAYSIGIVREGTGQVHLEP
jgi:phosphoribosylformylglycinamidine cyclo-ligase